MSTLVLMKYSVNNSLKSTAQRQQVALKCFYQYISYSTMLKWLTAFPCLQNPKKLKNNAKRTPKSSIEKRLPLLIDPTPPSH